MRIGVRGLAALAVAGSVALAALWWVWTRPALPEGIAEANGRLEAEQVQIAAKFAGRVDDVLVEEGALVQAGDVIARMDARDTKAQLREAEAQLLSVERQEEEAEAAIAEREASRKLAAQELARIEKLHKAGYASSQLLDQSRAQMSTAEAGLRAAQASLRQSIAGIDAAKAVVARIETVLDDAVLVAPRPGRVQYKLIEPGEIVAAGTPIVTLLDLSDIYMTVFLPARDAGVLAIGDEARLILDPAPQYVIPARVTFVAADAQFTPKSVETSDEREKLMFRVKLTIAPELLKQYEARAKTGVRGVAYLRVRRDVEWPAKLAVKLPEAASADQGK
jgi:HlyD family secretion protein